MKRIRRSLLVFTILLGSLVSIGLTESYFEISKNLDIFATLYRELNTYYVDETEPGELMKTGIDAMLESLDPFTTYIPESQIEDYKFMTTGQYGGIGALIHKEGDRIILSEPYEGFPAFKAGLRAGDELIEVGGKSTKGKSTSDISTILKGQPNTEVELLIKRPNQTTTEKIKVVREQIKINDVPYSGILDNNVGYLKLTGFTQTASREFATAFKDLKEQGAQSLIIDLRGNGGGLLNEAINIVNTMVPKGSKVVETRGKLKEWDATYRALNEPIDTEIPVVVLVNDNSASASEIVAGALQDYDRAVIIGQRTYGKGLVQQTKPLSYNAQLKITVAKYYIPSGRCIQRIDYSNRNDKGVAENVPDSLIKPFETLVNKREVYDGKGIKPDIETNSFEWSDLTATLYSKYHIFNYATEFQLQNEKIASAKAFEINDADYQKFTDYLKGKDYSYTTESEKLLERFKKTTQKEKYYEEAEEEFLALKEKLSQDKKEDLQEFKDEIKVILKREIVSRYYFQDGRIIASLNSDPTVLKAMDIINDASTYKSILKGSYKASKED